MTEQELMDRHGMTDQDLLDQLGVEAKGLKANDNWPEAKQKAWDNF